MEYTLIIAPQKEESLILTVRERNETVEAVEKLLGKKSEILTGYCDCDTALIRVNDADCFFTDSNKVYVCVKDKKYLLRQRLYQIEECLNDSFVRINQGCIINMNKVERFDMSFSGTIKVILKNGFEDYISRRQLKNVKRRFGI